MKPTMNESDSRQSGADLAHLYDTEELSRKASGTMLVANRGNESLLN